MHPGAGAFSGEFTTNLSRQCRAFSRALKIEKLKAPLFRGPKGAGATNDWCIMRMDITYQCVSVGFSNSFFLKGRLDPWRRSDLVKVSFKRKASRKENVR